MAERVEGKWIKCFVETFQNCRVREGMLSLFYPRHSPGKFWWTSNWHFCNWGPGISCPFADPAA